MLFSLLYLLVRLVLRVPSPAGKYIRTYDAVNSNYSSYSKYKAKISLTQRAKYHVKAYTKASDEWAGAVSAYSKTFTVKRVASLGTPKVPTSVRAGTTFSVSGTLKPRFPAGQKTVKIRLYRYGSGKWSYVRTYSAKNSNYSSYSKYKARIRLTTKAKYRFKAYTSTTTTWAGTSTGYGWTTTVR